MAPTLAETPGVGPNARAMQIVQLTHEHESALGDFLEDFARAGETEIPAYFGEASWSHAEIVEHLAAWARGERLPAGWVPCTTSHARGRR